MLDVNPCCFALQGSLDILIAPAVIVDESLAVALQTPAGVTGFQMDSALSGGMALSSRRACVG